MFRDGLVGEAGAPELLSMLVREASGVETNGVLHGKYLGIYECTTYKLLIQRLTTILHSLHPCRTRVFCPTSSPPVAGHPPLT